MVEQNDVGNERINEATRGVTDLVSSYWTERKNRNFDFQQVAELWRNAAERYPEYGNKITDIKQILDESYLNRRFNVLSTTWHLTGDKPIVERGRGEFIYFSILANRIGLNSPQVDKQPEEVAESFAKEVPQTMRELDIRDPENEITVEAVVRSALTGRLSLTPSSELPE